MGLSIVLEDERGTRIDGVDDPENLLHRLLPSADDLDSRCLRYVNWHGDTVFNQHQIVDVLQELRLLSENIRGDNEKRLLEGIIRLAEKCKREPHLYVKFYGD